MRCDVIAKTARKLRCQLTSSRYPSQSTISILEMIDLKFALFFFQMAAVTMAHMFRITNNCPFTVWPGIQGNPGHEHLENGGFSLGPYRTHLVISSRNWTGRIWGRTNCNSKGKCETGDCGKSTSWSNCNIGLLRYVWPLPYYMCCSENENWNVFIGLGS